MFGRGSLVPGLFTSIVLLGLFALARPSAQQQQLGGPVNTGAYDVVANWPQPLPDSQPGEHAGFTWGSGAGAHAESPDKIWVAQRGERPLPRGAQPWIIGGALIPPLMETGRDDDGPERRGWERRVHHVIFAVNREGKTIEEWKHLDQFFYPKGLMGRGPHKILMNPYDPEKHLWVVDDDLHEIHKFTNNGKLVMTLGERNVAGRGPNNFNRPTDIAWLPDGTFFVSDGYAGTRVAKFDPNGKFLLDWGQPPADLDKPGPNEFWSVHSIGLSRDRRVFVADREHSRMQVFDENGKFLEMWPTGHRSQVYAHIVTQDDAVWVADTRTQRLVKYDLNGRYMYDMGGPGALPGQFNGVHQIHVDQEGNLYLSEVWNGRSQKLSPKPKADRAFIVAPRVGDWQK
jgi:sugar lactone lactonase YvrE